MRLLRQFVLLGCFVVPPRNDVWFWYLLRPPSKGGITRSNPCIKSLRIPNDPEKETTFVVIPTNCSIPIMSENKYLYCLESVEDAEVPKRSAILTSMEMLTQQYGITNVYKTCDSIEGFEESISTLLYEDRNFKDYAVIYLVFEGRSNELKIDNYYYSFEEIAEFFEGKLKGKIIHFANTLQLDLEEETFQYFLDVTGAKAVSGYMNNVPVLSTVLDNLYFSLCQEYDDVVEITEILFEKQFALCTAMGFRMYY